MAVGNNEYGQLGIKNQITQLIPVPVDGGRMKGIAAGRYHSLFLDCKHQIFLYFPYLNIFYLKITGKFLLLEEMIKDKLEMEWLKQTIISFRFLVHFQL